MRIYSCVFSCVWFEKGHVGSLKSSESHWIGSISFWLRMVNIASLQAQAQGIKRQRETKELSERVEFARENLHFYMTEFVWTLNVDEHRGAEDSSGKWEQYPNVYYKDRPDYRSDLATILDVWLRERLLLIYKSRQMLMSWTMVACHLWMAQRNRDEIIFFQTLKEDKAGFSIPNQSLLSRAEGIMERQPDILTLGYNPNTDKKRKPPLMEFANGSIIFGISQDSDDPKSYSCSAIFSDEVAYQDKAEEAFNSARPTLGQHGKYTGVSTLNHHDPFFYVRCHGLDTETIPNNNAIRLDETGIYPKNEGMSVAKQTNGFVVVSYHYSADPSKRIPEWKARTKAGMDTVAWEQYYELNWDVARGHVYFSKFNKQRHVAEVEIDAVPNVPLLRGFDFGYAYPSMVIAQIHSGTLIILKVLHIPNIETHDFVSEGIRFTNRLFPGRIVRDCCDASGSQRLRTKISDVEIMRNLGLSPTFKWVKDDEYVLGLLKNFFNFETDDKPGIIINPSCSLLIEGFSGELRYPNSYSGGKRNSVLPVEKHPFIDVMDALKYIVYNFGGRLLDPNLGVSRTSPDTWGAPRPQVKSRSFMSV